MLCGSAFKNKGVQPLLDAVVDYLPSPARPRAIKGIDYKTEEEIVRPPDGRGSFSLLAFKIMDDPFVGTITFCRVYSGKVDSGSTVMNSKASPDGKILTLTVPIRGDDVSSQDVAAVLNLRQRLIPSAFAGSGAQVYVGGKTADEADYFHAVTSPTPYVLAFVLGLSFLLLMLAFRSLTIAAVSILLNLLSAGAAYGLLTLVFIHGAGAGIFGFQKVPVIDAWVPLFMFSVLFALSMDYQVFLMSRIKERYDQGGSTREAVAGGVASTAKIITGAALIIVAVFTGFARGQLLQFQEMGFGVAVALILDATLIRLVILPSTLSLLGQRSWYLPRWLDWLPHLQVEPPEAPSSDEPVTVARRL